MKILNQSLKLIAITFIIIAIITLPFIIINLVYKPTVTNDILSYETWAGNYFLPRLSELGNYSDIYYYEEDDGPNQKIALIVSYDTENYKKEVEYLSNTLVFQTEPIKDPAYDIDDIETHKYFDEYHEPSFEIGSFSFNIPSISYYGCNFPKSFGMIGQSDEQKKIVFLFYADPGLDGSASLSEFVELYFNWEELISQ